MAIVYSKTSFGFAGSVLMLALAATTASAQVGFRRAAPGVGAPGAGALPGAGVGAPGAGVARGVGAPGAGALPGRGVGAAGPGVARGAGAAGPGVAGNPYTRRR